MGALVGEIIKAVAGGIGEGIQGMAKAHDIKAPDTHSISSFNGGGSPSGIAAIPGIVEGEKAKEAPVQSQPVPQINIDTSKSKEGADAQAAGAAALRSGAGQGGGLLDSVLSDESKKENIEDSEYSAMRHYVNKMRGK